MQRNLEMVPIVSCSSYDFINDRFEFGSFVGRQIGNVLFDSCHVLTWENTCSPASDSLSSPATGSTASGSAFLYASMTPCSTDGTGSSHLEQPSAGSHCNSLGCYRTVAHEVDTEGSRPSRSRIDITSVARMSSIASNIRSFWSVKADL